MESDQASACATLHDLHGTTWCKRSMLCPSGDNKSDPMEELQAAIKEDVGVRTTFKQEKKKNKTKEASRIHNNGCQPKQQEEGRASVSAFCLNLALTLRPLPQLQFHLRTRGKTQDNVNLRS